MRRLTLCACLILTRSLDAQGSSPRQGDLRSALDTGFLIEDRNGDGHPDWVGARIIVPPRAPSATLAAAANVAARLGYETTALTPDLVGTGETEEPAVVIGDPSSARAADLGPGQGSIGWLPPDARWRRGGVSVDAGDGTGLLAASGYLAGRYPSVWSTRGATWSDLVQRLTALLAQDSVRAAVTLTRIVVQDRRPGIARAILDVQLENAADVGRAAALLARAAPGVRRPHRIGSGRRMS